MEINYRTAISAVFTALLTMVVAATDTRAAGQSDESRATAAVVVEPHSIQQTPIEIACLFCCNNSCNGAIA